ncbi:MAG: hypothetical protein CM15mP77_2740 [Synechococcus sp.]|nr:MAG: hypothetical protein CM15mP77_2740 [Synechococcus sp.]
MSSWGCFRHWPATPPAALWWWRGPVIFHRFASVSQGSGAEGDDLFQLGEELVGVDPISVQRVIGFEVIDFLEAVAKGDSAMESQHFRTRAPCALASAQPSQAAQELSARHQ